ncbi:MAG: DUF4270 family protein [Saprospirales bacterium]|nr:MAG: DUF4270 family protein [Saprospirales bacterium]
MRRSLGIFNSLENYTFYMFRKNPLILLLVSLAFILAVSSGPGCNDPSFVGSDLVEGDAIDSEIMRDFDMRTRLVKTDSVLVYDQIAFTNGFHVGRYHNEKFGTVQSDLALQFLLETPSVDTAANIQIDSVVLSLRYNENLFYGDSSQPVNIDVLRLTELIPRDGRYYSNEMFPVSMEAVGSIQNHIHKPNTPLTRILDGDGEENGADTVLLNPQLRINLNESLGVELLSFDTLAVQSDSAFLANFGGLYLQQTMGDRSIAAFDLNSVSTALTVYYQADGQESIKRYLPIQDLTLRAPIYTHDYQGSNLENSIGQWQDSMVAVQGLSGLGTQLEISGMEELQGTLINNARLRMVLDDRFSEENNALFPEIQALAMRSVEEDGSIPFITDLIVEQQTNISINFGGRLIQDEVAGDTVSVYEMNITTHLQEALKNGSKTTLLVTPRSRLGLPGNSMIYGPGHPDYPVELKVIFTKEQDQ